MILTIFGPDVLELPPPSKLPSVALADATNATRIMQTKTYTRIAQMIRTTIITISRIVRVTISLHIEMHRYTAPTQFTIFTCYRCLPFYLHAWERYTWCVCSCNLSKSRKLNGTLVCFGECLLYQKFGVRKAKFTKTINEPNESTRHIYLIPFLGVSLVTFVCDVWRCCCAFFVSLPTPFE